VPQYTHACTCIHARAPPPPSSVLPLRYTLNVSPSLVHQHTHARTCTSTRMHARAPAHACTHVHQHTHTRTCTNTRIHARAPTHASQKSARGGWPGRFSGGGETPTAVTDSARRPLPIQRGARYRFSEAPVTDPARRPLPIERGTRYRFSEAPVTDPARRPLPIQRGARYRFSEAPVTDSRAHEAPAAAGAAAAGDPVCSFLYSQGLLHPAPLLCMCARVRACVRACVRVFGRGRTSQAHRFRP
jgi:hypothetical protein